VNMIQLSSFKVVRDMKTGNTLGYGFVNYETTEAAEKAIQTINGHKVQHKTLKVGWTLCM